MLFDAAMDFEDFVQISDDEGCAEGTQNSENQGLTPEEHPSVTNASGSSPLIQEHASPISMVAPSGAVSQKRSRSEIIITEPSGRRPKASYSEKGK